MLTNLSSTKKIKLIFLSIIAISFVTNHLNAEDHKQNGIFINHAYSSPTRPGTNNGVMYIVEIKNSSKVEDYLTSVFTSIAESTEIHTMKITNGTMQMRKISSIRLPLNESVSLKKGNPDGYHIMLLGIKRKLQDGDSFYATFNFKNSPSMKVNVEVIKSKDKHKH